MLRPVTATPLSVPTPGGPALVELSRPAGATALVLLTHGAAGGAGSVDLLSARDGLVAHGVAVGLVTQAYRVAGRRTPPAPAAQDEAWCALVTAVRRRRGLRAVPLVVGGRSNGARVACRTADRVGADGVLALAFPLHPPGRPDKSRLAELDAPHCPVLVVQGDRDPFGLPSPAAGRDVVVIAGADHSLRRDPATSAAAVQSFVTSLIARARVLG